MHSRLIRWARCAYIVVLCRQKPAHNWECKWELLTWLNTRCGELVETWIQLIKLSWNKFDLINVDSPDFGAVNTLVLMSNALPRLVNIVSNVTTLSNMPNVESDRATKKPTETPSLLLSHCSAWHCPGGPGGPAGPGGPRGPGVLLLHLLLVRLFREL